MREKSTLAKNLVSMSSEEIKVDMNVKKILAHKPLLARILKEVMAECDDMSYEQIEGCIEGEVRISEVPLEPGMTNAVDQITGQAQEAYDYEEGLIVYDLRTYLKFPGGDVKPVKVLLNVEAQNEEKPGYDISLRALFYCCRMISEQLGTEFTTCTDDPVKYGNIKKVYSIWICTETSGIRENTIEKYEINRKFLVGSNPDAPRYDILNAAIINISAKHNKDSVDNELLRMLTDLFDERVDGQKKIEILENEYGLPLTREIREELKNMCTYGASIARKNAESGINEGLDMGLKALVNSLKKFIKDFDALYKEVISNEEYSQMTKEEVKKYY